MLKQQLQKTEEEVSDFFTTRVGIEFSTTPNVLEMTVQMPKNLFAIQDMIRQSQIDAVKAFADEIIEKSECNPMECSYKENINNLLKDI